MLCHPTHRRNHLQMIAALALSLSASKVALSWAADAAASPAVMPSVKPTIQQQQPPIQDPQALDFFVPAELGYVIETHRAATSAQPTIVHIQEAHTNYEGQQHLIGILELLIKQRGLRLILVEGGEGDVSLAYLRHYGSPQRRREAAEKFLKAGILSAEEYLDIVSDAPLILWGVEDRRLYNAHVAAFLDVEPLQRTLAPTLAALQRAVEALRPSLLDRALLSLQSHMEAFERQRVSVGEYAEFLETLASARQIPTTPWPNLTHFLHARAAEAALRAPDAQDRQQRLLQLQEAKLVQATALADELGALAQQLQRALTEASGHPQFLRAAEGIGLLDKLLALRLSPEEYTRWQALHGQESVSQWSALLAQTLARQGLSAPAVPDVAQLEASLPRIDAFYQAAFRRDQALIDHALAKLKDTGERLAVLITGGFHSPELTRRLAAQGLGVVVAVPKTTTETNDAHYRALLKYKSGHGSLEEVFATAGMEISEVSTP